jgi:tetratricopeptide (TPR) repeat protein
MSLRAAYLALLVVFLSAPAFAQDPASSLKAPQTPEAQAQTDASKLSPRQMKELRADILMARKLFPDAIALYEELASAEPKNAVLSNKIGIAYQQLGRPDRAEHYYKRAVKADKTYANALNNLGTIQYEKQNYRKAIRYYKQALEGGTDVATVYSNLGYAYFGDKRYPDAMQAFQQALAVDPEILSKRGGFGTIVQQRSVNDTGLFYFLVAKTYALAGDAERCAHYLKMARDEKYKDISTVKTDPAFKKVMEDPRVIEVLATLPSIAEGPRKP